MQVEVVEVAVAVVVAEVDGEAGEAVAAAIAMVDREKAKRKVIPNLQPPTARLMQQTRTMRAHKRAKSVNVL